MTQYPAQNIILWHYQSELPRFLKERVLLFGQIAKVFNILGLLRNLVAPYRRLAVTGKSQKFFAKDLLDKLTFNLTSSIVGFTVRIILICAWFLATLFMFLISIPLVLVWLIFPFVAIDRFLKIKNSYIFEGDLENAASFSKKLTGSAFFKLLSIFFDESFEKIFSALPNPQTLGITSGQKAADTIFLLAEKWQDLREYFAKTNINNADFKTLVEHLNFDLETPKSVAFPAIGRTLSYGYTNTLDRYASEIASSRLPSQKREELLGKIQNVLTRLENNNVLLVGEPGVGKHNLIFELAAMIKRLQIKSLEDKRLMLLDTVALAGSGKTLIEAKSAFEAVIAEAKNAGNIILVVDHIDQISSPRDNRIDLTDVLALTLNDNNLPIIGITTPENFKKYIQVNSSFLKLFEKFDIEEATATQTLDIVISKSLEAFRKEKIAVTLRAISEIVTKSEKLISERRQPDKSILLLEDAIALAKNRKLKTVDEKLIDELLSEKVHLPVGQITKSEAEKLKNLEAILHKRIIGQDEAIDEIARAMRRARAEVEVGNRPIGSFLFLGPTGVGKTETAKALAQTYFGDENKMVRLDMSEFQDEDSLKKLIGDIDKEVPGRLASEIRQNPYCLLLVDEFEKATKDVQNLFLQILDEGFLTDSFGKKVKFDNVIIIATSNAGAEFIREEVAKETADLSTKLVEFVLSEGLFNPELINRFDGVVVYKPLTEDQIIKVTKLMLLSLAQKLKDTKNLSLEITDELAEKVAKQGFDPQFGARPIRRLIQDKIEDGIAKMIIDSSAKSGTAIPAATLLKFLS